mgnify:CR=1 FL=1
MKDSNDIIIRPVISEKSTQLAGNNKYVFQVAMDANKMMVSRAIKDLFGVNPEKVNIIVVRGKARRLRFRAGKKSAWKKAVVTLKPGEKIELFESQ